MYCRKCGGKLESYASNCAFCGTPVEKYDTNVNYVQKAAPSNDFKPMSAWKWIGLTFLPLIPLVGSIIYLVLMFKWAFGSTKDLSLKGYARANLIMMLFAIVIIILVTIISTLGIFGDFTNNLGTQM